jgi:hypothetical protein
VQGYPDSTFRPSNSINRAEAIKIIVESLGKLEESGAVLPEDVPKDEWFAKYVESAIALNIIDKQAEFKPDEPLLRNDLAKWIFKALEIAS